MKPFTLALMAWAGLAAGAQAAPAADDPTACVRQFIDAFDKGDAKAAAATHWTQALTIIDEVPPYVWKGPKAFSTWASDLVRNDAAKGITGESVALGDVIRVEQDGRRAYVVMAATYRFKDHGVASHEAAQMTFALRKGPTGWKISAWTFTGPKPSPD